MKDNLVEGDNEVGKKTWAIAEGYIPSDDESKEPWLISHEAACILNPNKGEAHVKLSIYFTDSDPVNYDVRVPGERTLHLRFNELSNPKIPRDTDYSSVFRSDVPVVIQHTRLDSRTSEAALLSTLAYSQ